MKVVNNKLLVRVNMEQKSLMSISGIELRTALQYGTNYRERSPVVAEVMETKSEFAMGDLILCHHNHFYGNSPYWLKDDLFSIPLNHTIFAIIDKDGEPKAVQGNIIAEQIEVPSFLPLPPEQMEVYKDRVKVLSNGCGYKKGQLVFTKLHAPYIIIYIFNTVQRKVVKVNSEMIIGKVM